MAVFIIGEAGSERFSDGLRIDSSKQIHFWRELGDSWNGLDVTQISSIWHVFSAAQEEMTVRDGDRIPNWELHPVTAEFYEWIRTVPQDIFVITVDTTRVLCTDEDGDRCVEGEHQCDGLLAEPYVAGDDDIYVIACHSFDLSRLAGGQTEGADGQAASDNPEADEWRRQMLEFLQGSDTDTRQQWFEGADEATRQYILQDDELRQHVEQ